MLTNIAIRLKYYPLCFDKENKSEVYRMESVIKKIKQDKVRFIELNFTDMFGGLKSIDLPVECLQEAVEKGVWFDGSSIKGFLRIKESDMYLKPDISTYAVFPVDDDNKKTASFFCDVFTPDGSLFNASPRYVLKKVLGEAREMGFEFKVGPEVEFYLFKKKDDSTFITPESDTGSYFDSPIEDVGSDMRKEVMLALNSIGIDSERAHNEVGEGQHEIGFRYGESLKTADRVIRLKKIIKSVSYNHGLTASFMPKPIFGKNGNGMHVHFSLFDNNGSPLFFDANDKNNLSPLSKNFIAGELAFAREMSLLLNPTVNSYKRLVLGYEAPVYICWGGRNRSALIRIPRYTKGRESSARAELRCPDPGASPYFVFAAILKAGLEGIKRKMKLTPEIEDNVYEKTREEIKKLDIGILPSSLGEALDEFKKSRLMKEMLGEELFKYYIQAKEKEHGEFRVAVTDWEINKYLEKS